MDEEVGMKLVLLLGGSMRSDGGEELVKLWTLWEEASLVFFSVNQMWSFGFQLLFQYQ